MGDCEAENYEIHRRNNVNFTQKSRASKVKKIHVCIFVVLRGVMLHVGINILIYL